MPKGICGMCGEIGEIEDLEIVDNDFLCGDCIDDLEAEEAAEADGEEDDVILTLIDDINNHDEEIENLEQRVDDLEEVVSALIDVIERITDDGE